MSQGRDRYRLSLTPGGAGVLTLFFPGLLVALASAQRPLAALSVGAALVLAVNALWARLVLGRLTVFVEGPAVATVGAAESLIVSLGGPRGMEGAVAIDGGLRPWVPIRVPDSGLMLWRARQRGVVERVTVRVQTSIPLGLTAVVRVSPVPVLSSEGWLSPIHAVPGPAPVVVPPARSASVVGEVPGLAAGPGDPIGLRQYRIGDTVRDMHWPTVARTGALMVRDRADLADDAITVVVIEASHPHPHPGTDPATDPGTDAVSGHSRALDTPAADEVLARARGVLHQLLSAGHRVELRTVEAGSQAGAAEPNTWWARRRARRRDSGGPHEAVQVVSGPVRSRDDVARRLARIVPGPVAAGGSAGDSTVGYTVRSAVEVPVLVIDGSGERWQPPA